MDKDRNLEGVHFLVRIARETPPQPITLIRERVERYLRLDLEKQVKRRDTWTEHIISRTVREMRRQGVRDEAMVQGEGLYRLIRSILLTASI